MIRNVYLTLTLLLLTSLSAFAQSGAIKGKVVNKATKEPIPFAVVVAEMNGSQVGGSQSDFDGEYTIKPLQPGKYTIKVKSVGFNDLVINDVVVGIDRITFTDLTVSPKVIETQVVDIIEYKVPLIDKGNTQTGATVTREDIQAAPTRDVRAVATNAAGVFQKDEGDDVTVRGSRKEATDYYVDGIRIRGSTKLPQGGVEQVTAIVGGTPAQYGDATGGIISVTTRGPSKDFSGGLELATSELFDKYGYNLVSANLSGPILKKKMESGGEKAILGFFVSGEAELEKDPDPSAIGMYQLKGSLYDQLKKNPIAPYQTGANTFGSFNNAIYYTDKDFEKSTIKSNIAQSAYRFTAKIDFQPVDNTSVSFGGSFNVNDRSSFALNRSTYNFAENPQIKDTDYRIFGRLTQRIGSTYKAEQDKSASVFKNVYFSLQAEYSKNKQVNQDDAQKGNLWNYGYYGKLALQSPKDTLSGTVFGGTADTSYIITSNSGYVFTPGTINEIQSNYGIAADAFYQDATGSNQYGSIGTFRSVGGLANGDAVGSIMGIWEGIGNQRNLYQDFDNDQFRFVLSGNADVKKHALSIGFEYEQRFDRGYSIAPRGLWTIGRLFANDPNKFTRNAGQDLTAISGTTVDGNTTYLQLTDFYTPITDENLNTTGFHENLRNSLGLANNQYVDFDALSPDQLNMSMFNSDELTINGVLGYYYGYDYTGKKTKGTQDYASAFKKFFNDKTNGVYDRLVPAWQPTYMAAYIQDQFAIDNLNFNVGLRIDRFDANQKALKDKYLLLDSYRVGDYPVAIVNRPGNIGDDYVPYIANASDLTSIVGYRNENVWYDQNGQVVSDPDIIAQQSSSSTILPALKESAGKLASSTWDIDNVFQDYEPQISIMPRVAFAFSITDQAQFFAHYDVLTQRPSSNLRNDPIEYLALTTNPDGTLNNSNLKPEKTTDYELGFKQVLGRTSSLTISAFYRELNNNIQITKVNFAYPNTYTSYDNIDFGTVKGLSLSYDLRRTGNIRVLASYTLQFADGTGSGANSNVELTDTDQPNIRFIIPLDFDQRHTVTASIDYRYGDGADYNGPTLWGKPILANFGANFVFKANSGTPYSRQSRPTQEGAAIGWQDNGQRAIEGVINGARTPWQFRVDMRIDKDFAIKMGEKKKTSINVYLQIQNIFDIRNVVGVYRATGNPDDDGFIYSPDGQQLSASQQDPQAFIDQYQIKIRNPDNYSLPRRARLGVSFQF